MRILFVAMPDSVHTARWITQLSDQGWDLHLFPVYDAPPHPLLRNVTVYSLSSYRPPGLDRSVRLRGFWPLRRGAWWLSRQLRRLFPRWGARGLWLAHLIRWLKPDMIHSQEIQHAGYLTLEARERLAGRFPPWIVANWGSDIYLFGRLSEHVDRIRAVMAACDYYHCECHRDVPLARDYGFRGTALPVCPVSGGVDLAEMRPFRQAGPTSARRLIALKGYQTWAGRALVGLRAIELCADVLKGYRVVIYLATPDVALAAELVAKATGIPIEVDSHEHRRMPREDILRMHGRARVSIGLSISDAISTSFLEAMIMGSFPIQSNTGCANEWATDGEGALLVHPEDPGAVAAALRRAVADDSLVDRAAEINAKVVSERLDYAKIKSQAVAIYQRVAEETGAKRGARPV
jgi:glycosyltransferase involved in cell wall biosynthesis